MIKIIINSALILSFFMAEMAVAGIVTVNYTGKVTYLERHDGYDDENHVAYDFGYGLYDVFSSSFTINLANLPSDTNDNPNRGEYLDNLYKTEFVSSSEMPLFKGDPNSSGYRNYDRVLIGDKVNVNSYGSFSYSSLRILDSWSYEADGEIQQYRFDLEILDLSSSFFSGESLERSLSIDKSELDAMGFEGEWYVYNTKSDGQWRETNHMHFDITSLEYTYSASSSDNFTEVSAPGTFSVMLSGIFLLGIRRLVKNYNSN